MDKYLEMISVPAIAATVFWVLYIVKKTVNSDSLTEGFRSLRQASE